MTNSFGGKLKRVLGMNIRKSGKRISTKDLFTDSLMGNTLRSYMVAPGQPVWMDRNYPQFSLEAYIRNVIANRSIGMVAGAAASVKIKLYAIGPDGVRQEIKAHPILDILKQPNPTQAMSEFFKSLYKYRLISGNAYIQSVAAQNAVPSELYLLRPDRVMVIAGKGTMPGGYRYTVGNDSRDFRVDPITGASPILHIKNFHPLNDWYGLSAVEAAAYSIDQHNQAGAWNQALLQNGARPSGALVVKSDAPGGGVLSESQYNRVRQQMDEQFSGSGNAGRPLLLEGGLDWREMSLSPKDMDFIEAKNSSARDIALAFGVPPQLLGIPGDNTYSNLQEARLALWEQTIVPLVSMTVDAFNRWLIPMFGGNLELAPDIDSISALAIRNQTIWDRVEKATFLTDDEKRAAVGYGPLPQVKKNFSANLKYSPDQPRDEDGKWTSGGGDDGNSSDDSGEANTGAATAIGAVGAGMAAAPKTWGNPDTLQNKFNRHGADFDAETPEDYANQASNFYQKFQAEKLPAIEYPNGGEIGVYDPASNSFGVYNADGTTATFYKPKSPTYFQRQVNDAVTNGGKIINPLSGPEGSGGSGARGGDLFSRPGDIMHPADETPNE